MKRRGWMLEQVADIENLRLAFWKAKKGKNAVKEVLDFYKPSLDNNLLALRTQILCGKIAVGGYRYFKIYDPKERLICSAPFYQRVLHHAIMNICHYDFDKVQIYDSYASRVGKGTYAALDRAIKFTNKYAYVLKLDIRKYFDSIDHQVLKTQLKRMYKDVKLLDIFSKIIDSYEVAKGKGLPIGNLTSQYFANHYLCQLDHYVKEQLHVQAYVRYMDDIMIWDNSKVRIKMIGRDIVNYLENVLKLTIKVFILRPTIINVDFLGYRLSKRVVTLSKRSFDRFLSHMRNIARAFNLDLISQDDVRRRLTPILSFVEKVPSKSIKQIAMEYFI